MTKIDEARLEELSKTNPVFAPGVENFVAMGGIRALWRGELKAQLLSALADSSTQDQRAVDGATRGGRKLAAAVAERVVEA